MLDKHGIIYIFTDGLKRDIVKDYIKKIRSKPFSVNIDLARKKIS